MSYQLKVKFCSLQAEAKIIRRLEQRYKRAKARATREEHKAEHRAAHMDLRAHRKGIVSYEARHTHLARMFLKGTPYRAAEREGSSTPNWEKVLGMARKYGPAGYDYENFFAVWKDAEKVD